MSSLYQCALIVSFTVSECLLNDRQTKRVRPGDTSLITTKYFRQTTKSILASSTSRPILKTGARANIIAGTFRLCLASWFAPTASIYITLFDLHLYSKIKIKRPLHLPTNENQPFPSHIGEDQPSLLARK